MKQPPLPYSNFHSARFRSITVSLFYYLILTLLFSYGCSSGSRYDEVEITGTIPIDEDALLIDALLDESTGALRIPLKAPATLAAGQKFIRELGTGAVITARASSGEVSLTVDGASYKGSGFQLLPQSGGYLHYNGSSYRGTFMVKANKSKALLVNRLPLEPYLQGVLPKEMGGTHNSDHFEALKAFAVAARTFALMKMSEANTFFDVTNDTRTQVYGGIESETEITNAAVEATEGMILTYNGWPASIFYHSTCGGRTANGADVFPNARRDYLKSIDDEGYCSHSPSFEWTERFTANRFLKSLRDGGYRFAGDASLASVEVDGRFECGRAAALRVELTSGEEIVIPSNRIRPVFRREKSGGMLKSVYFELEILERRGRIDEVVFTGNGFGHGVGMCQWGAFGRSKDGQHWREILGAYFRGTEIRRIQ